MPTIAVTKIFRKMDDCKIWQQRGIMVVAKSQGLLENRNVERSVVKLQMMPVILGIVWVWRSAP